jgi:hypothetical protein
MNSSVGLATGYELDDEEIGVKIPARGISLFHSVQTDSGAYPASYQSIARVLFLGGKCMSRAGYRSLA